ncbi:unnamed protein product [Microthlaspi erraticum]|uniref:Uncharacterized protein n=1 Tax=Microthlaspi erraticum TaxID=1685480 RepID=A0A6D2J9V5_9BRAS|nr:unnamed protein product [Microthlaspi erraticum]
MACLDDICLVQTNTTQFLFFGLQSLSIMGTEERGRPDPAHHWPNRRISLANVDKDTFYDAAPPGFSSKRFRYTSGGECSQVRGESHGYLIKEVLQDKMHLQPSSTRKFWEPPILPK